MKETTFFSILIPCFNSEATVEQCIFSVLQQTYDNWEIVAVDDGSSDDTYRKIKAIAAKSEKQIRVVHRENCGQLISRQEAGRLADGDYFIYLDSDDTLEPRALSILNLIIKKYPNSLIQFRHRANFCGKTAIGPVYDSCYECPAEITIEEFRKIVCMSSDYNCLWGKAIPAAASGSEIDLHDYSFMRSSEDLLQLIAGPLNRVNNVVLIDDVLYNYNILSTGMTETFQPNLFDSIVASNKFLYTNIQKWNDVDCLSKFWDRCIRTTYGALLNLCNSDYNSDELEIELKKIAKDALFRGAWSKRTTKTIQQDILLTPLIKGKYKKVIFRLKIYKLIRYLKRCINKSEK